MNKIISETPSLLRYTLLRYTLLCSATYIHFNLISHKNPKRFHPTLYANLNPYSERKSTKISTTSTTSELPMP